jgi:hypothetical protein
MKVAAHDCPAQSDMVSDVSILAVVALVFCGLVAVIYGVCLLGPAVGTFPEDGVYLATARALAEQRDYRILSVPGELGETARDEALRHRVMRRRARP